MRFDRESVRSESTWLQRLLVGHADPHLDQEIRKLPMSVRIAVLEYADSRHEFCSINSAAGRTSSGCQTGTAVTTQLLLKPNASTASRPRGFFRN